MIKKINISLILITILSSIYFAIFKEENIVFMLKDLSIIFTINGLYILEKIFKTKINDTLKLLYIIFTFMAHFLGVIVDLYSKIYWYDKFIHFISGIITSLGAIYFLKKTNNKNIIFNILFILSFTMFVASIWEVFEYISSFYFGVDPQKVISTGVMDTMGDIIVALLGSILVCVSYYYEIKYKFNLLVNKYIKLIEIK